MLTSEITAASSEPPPNMEDARIGLIDNHMYETIVVANRVYTHHFHDKGPSTKFDKFIRVTMEKIEKIEIFRNVKTPIETLTPVL